jgi:hypothetical protein
MSDLLFINKDAKSPSIRRHTAAEKFSINAHVQRGRKHVRRDQMPIRLNDQRQRLLEFRLSETAASAGPVGEDEDGQELLADLPDEGYESFEGPTDERTLTLESSSNLRNREGNKQDRRVENSRLNASRSWHLHQQRRQFLDRAICLKDEAVDPFDRSCIKVDSEVHSLLQFYLRVFHPNTWHTEAHKQSRSLGKYKYARGAHDIVQGCFEDEMNMYCVLASMASFLQVFEHVQIHRNVNYYMSRALTATRQKIEDHQQTTGIAAIVNPRMILNSFYLGVAEWYRLELDASFIHIQAVKQMVNCLGGMKCIDGQMREAFALGDTYLAAERLAKPVFDPADFDPGLDTAISTWSRRFGLAGRKKRTELLHGAHQQIVPQDLRQIIEDLDDYIAVLILSQQYSDFPTETPHWIHTRDLATRNRLLALDVADVRTEALRVALIMWELTVMTVSARKRTVKLMAPKLKGILLKTKLQDWIGHEPVLCWIFSVGSMSAAAYSDTEAWFTNELVRLPTTCWNNHLTPDESAIRSLASRFFYLESVQEPILKDLMLRIATAWTRRPFTNDS